ncbi:type I-F CRISPR-associated protein Csy1 [Methylomarinum sp. Ch1-1]|uniref:Type I-F CRISPR-associated protein Csy1 n=1 Tax=Methylomarinum roseum TaxID=3067653 RepID=A0AAU7NZF0_9GAMM|nr:type I-F CRISPR-associated protein Csy1 [Methylomarinum sp. Ch1-1]MDP4521391.1 type I-F CRISPR-associated protein Csy1 [Methylomarinum sp. Ch1-1]
MLDPAIQAFLNERKELWLKKKITTKTSENEQAELKMQAVEAFSLDEWLPDAAKRARQLSMVSHPGKFSHPSAKTSAVIATAQRQADGFLRSGNVAVDLDVLGNAAALDVHKFLSIYLSDGATVLEHLEQQTETIRQQFTLHTAPFDEIEAGLLAIKQTGDSSVKTSERVKQVYFPVDQAEYHLLSVLTPSSIMFKLKERINVLRFSDEVKEIREAKKNNLYHEKSLSELYGLSVIGFGGTKPQNISVLNNKNGGTAYLLASTPPMLEQRTNQPPRTDFFVGYLNTKSYAEDFNKLHKLLVSDANNMHIRKQRDWLIRTIIYQVADRLWQVRFLPAGWSDSDNYAQLTHYQKIWLDQQYQGQRSENTDYLSKVKQELAIWFINTYKKLLDDQAVSLGDEQLSAIKELIEDCEEALR